MVFSSTIFEQTIYAQLLFFIGFSYHFNFKEKKRKTNFSNFLLFDFNLGKSSDVFVWKHVN